jgi:DNA (cytosine-5)-methyltransferase 1
MTDKLKVLGLFSGIGGFEKGLQQAGMEISAYSEIEDMCLKVLRKNFKECKEFTDVKDIVKTDESYDVLCGGFPCQDISIGGKNAGLLEGEKSSLWLEYKRVINEQRPKYAIIENVSALLGRGLNIILQNLAEIGYDATWTMFDSKYFGVPQRRRRVYIVAVRDGIPDGTEIFNFKGRDSTKGTLKHKIKAVEESFEWNIESGDQGEQAFAYFTRQRSDEFAEVGLSSTLLKRDYKDFMDVIVTDDGNIRKVAPDERLLFQSYPADWWDGCDLSNTEKYKCNGMTVNVVEYIGRKIIEFDKNV